MHSNPTNGGDWNDWVASVKKTPDCTTGSEPPASSLLYCHEARALLGAFSEAIREVIRLHEEQFQAVIQGDEDSGRFDDLIHIANERKREAKYAYLHHLEVHRCSRLVADDLKR